MNDHPSNPYVLLKGIRVDDLNCAEILDRIPVIVKQRRPTHIVTLNAEMFWIAQRKKIFKDLINSAEIVTPDGAGILWAARLFRHRLKTRVSGYELFKWFLTWANDNKSTIFLLGGRSRVLDKLAAIIVRSYRNIRIVGRHHGYFDAEREKEIVESIRKTRPDFLFVGMGAYQQEVFIYNWREEIRVPVMIGVGGTFDAFTGNAPRVARWIGALGLEWFVRLLLDPRRIGRIWKLPLFVIEMIWYRIFQAKVV